MSTVENSKMGDERLIVWIDEIGKEDIPIAGGKGANLGEMLKAGIPVPPAFIVTAQTYKKFLQEAGLLDGINRILKGVNVDDPKQLTTAGQESRDLILKARMPGATAKAIKDAYQQLCRKVDEVAVFTAVRSSATAEDLPEASFAGQQATYLNVRGGDAVVENVQKCWASLFTDRAIFYREKHNFDHSKVFMSVIVQKMVNSDAAGVTFTVHPVTAERDKIVIESSWGLGESVVSGAVTPDEFVVEKNTFQILDKKMSDKKKVMRVKDPSTGQTVECEVPPEKVEAQSISDSLVVELAKIAKRIEDHYKFPQDIEWAVEDGVPYIVQTRAVTALKPRVEKKVEEGLGEVLIKGLGASPGRGSGPVNVVLEVENIEQVKKWDILVTKMTNPDWVPAMVRASAIVTDEGGMTCHAAIVSRELGTPCIVGTVNATTALGKYQGGIVTVDGQHGIVYKGAERVEEKAGVVEAPAVQVMIQQPITATKVYVNLSIPELAEKVARETNADGVGLLRAEHLLVTIGKHPRKLIEEGGEKKMVDAFTDGIRKVAGAFYPRPVIYRFLDFKPDEFLGLEGGEVEKTLGHVGPNPLIGFRGAFRYRKEPEIFRLECLAIKKVREEYNLKNVHVMIPFVRTMADLVDTKKLMEESGLRKGPDFRLWIMVEVPNTVFLIDKFIEAGIDGISFGTNDLTMLILGIDRDDASIQEIYDERDSGVLRALAHVIRECNKHGVTTSICGQAPSVYPEYSEFLVRQGATSVSVNPDTVVATRRLIATIEQKILLEKALGTRAEGSDEHKW